MDSQHREVLDQKSHDLDHYDNRDHDDHDNTEPEAEPYSLYYPGKESYLSDPPNHQPDTSANQSFSFGQRSDEEACKDDEIGDEVDGSDQISEDRGGVNESAASVGDDIDGEGGTEDTSTDENNNTENDDVHYDVEMEVDVQFDGDASGITEGAFVSFKYDGVAGNVPLFPKISFENCSITSNELT